MHARNQRVLAAGGEVGGVEKPLKQQNRLTETGVAQSHRGLQIEQRKTIDDVGAIAALVFATTSFLWPKTIAVLASMAATLYLTGAFHEDGWCDMADGFGGGWTRARILEIMKDSRIGSYGALALIVLLLAKFCALIEIDTTRVAPALVAGHALSRLCATAVLHTLDYARSEGKAKPLADRKPRGDLVVGACTTLAALALLPLQQAVSGALFAALSTLWLTRMFRKQLGGYTGDCLGATQQFAELAFYGGLLCRFS